MVVLKEKREIVRRGASNIYSISAYVSDVGNLPDGAVFVYEILLAQNPAVDKFVRVASVNDLVTLRSDRILAISDNAKFYRARGLTVEYTNLSVAITAQGLIEGYVNDLVVAYEGFSTNFSTAGLPGPPADYATITFPLVEDALKAALIDQYLTVRAQRIAQEEAIAAKTVACDALSAEISVLGSQTATLSTIRDAVSGLLLRTQNVQVHLVTMLNDAEEMSAIARAGIAAYEDDVTNAYIDASAGSRVYFRDPDPDSILETNEGSLIAAVREHDARIEVSHALVEKLGLQRLALQNAIGIVDGQLTTLATTTTTTQANANTCGSELTVMNQVLTALQASEQSALDSVLDVCPDYQAPAV